ncbi:MAG: hypothetical protein AUG51_21575 [Acidobacteria bacterium 13_1_20CM_3_53_8]|nr:MAG: hypothetical protein AUG51_21575 [Acidobacteria bacterium 13_1_20CM_3_53_8]
MRSKKEKYDPLPEHFDSIEAAAEFWDTHDSADYEEYMKDVECEFDIKQRTYLISLDSGLYRKVRDIAKRKGMPTDKLVNLWLEEKAS